MATTYKLEVAFATDPLSASPTWTDITAYLLGDGEIQRGRQNEFADVQTGQMTVVLDNSDGRFTRGLTSGAYYPNVLKSKRIRFTMTVNSTNYIRFDGFVNEWPVNWPGGGRQCDITVTASDNFKRLGGQAELRPFIQEEAFLSNALIAYWPLSEGAGQENLPTLSAGDIAGVGAPALALTQVGSGGTIDWGQGTAPGADGLTAPVFTPFSSTAGQILMATMSTLPDLNNLTIEFWIRTTNTGHDVVCLYGSSGMMAINLDSGTDHIRLAHLDGTGAVIAEHTFTTPDVVDGHSHLITVEISGQTTTKVWTDGVLRETDTTTFTWPINRFDKISVGGRNFGDLVNLYIGTLSNVVIWNDTVGSNSANRNNMGNQGYIETSDARIDRIAGYAGLAGVSTLGSGFTNVSTQSAGGTAPIDAMKAVERTEKGLLSAPRDDALSLEFQARSYRYNRSSEFTLDASKMEIGPDSTFVDDDQFLHNDVIYSRDGGASIRWKNDASITAYGRYSDTFTGLWTTDTEVTAAAQWVTSRYGDPTLRMSEVTFEASTLTLSTYQAILAADLSSLFTITNLPAQAPTSSVTYFIEGYKETIGLGRHDFTVNTSPNEPATVWQLDSSTYSVLGTSTRLAY